MEAFVINKDYMVCALKHAQHKMQIKSKIQRKLILKMLGINMILDQSNLVVCVILAVMVFLDHIYIIYLEQMRC